MTKQRPVLVKLMFKVRAEDARSFTASQIGDLSETRMTLGSTQGKLKRKQLKKEDPLVVERGTVALQWRDYGGVTPHVVNVKKQSVIHAGPASVSLYFARADVGSYDKKKASADVFGLEGFYVPAGLAAGEKDPGPDTKIRFNGTINVAAGKYQEFFGAEANLIYDPATGEGTLRIYKHE